VRKILVVLIVAVAVSFAATVDANAAPQPAGPLRVGAEVPQPNFWNDVPPGAPTPGFEAELANGLAARLGRNGVSVVRIPFNTLIAGKAKGYDVALEQALITDGGDSSVEFSRPYLDFDVGVLVRSGESVLNTETARRLRWGVATSMATPVRFLHRDLKPTTKPQTFPDLAQAVKALELQQVDAVLDYTVSAMRQAEVSGGKLAVVAQFHTGEKLGAVLPEGSPLLDRVNAAIKAFKADGTLGRLAATYLGGDPSTVPFLKT
jgi:polar amino acid transport system substrate-binding protein